MTTRFLPRTSLPLFAAVIGCCITGERVHSQDFGSSLAFNGVNQYVSVPNFGSVAPGTEVTVEFWALTDVEAQQAAFMLSPDVPANRFNAHLNYSNGNTYWDFGDINSGGRVSMPNPANTLGVWTHYAFVASQAQVVMRIYINGEAVASTATMNPFEATGSHELRIGGSTNFHFHGKLDEFRVWNVARSQTEIQNGRFNPPAGTETGLRLYYRFDEGSGTVALNSAAATGSAHNGTLVNAPSWGGSSPRLALNLAHTGTISAVNNPWTMGYSFTASSAISVDSLGLFVQQATVPGLVNEHRVGLWKDDGTFLASATLPAGTGTSVVPSLAAIGVWRFTPITPVLLQPGTYRIGATYRGVDTDGFDASPSNVQSTPGITRGFLCTAMGHTLTFPSNTTVGFQPHIGPNFQFTSVGTPGHVSLTGWLGSHGLTGSDALPAADPDYDGQPNVLEFVFGGNPAFGSARVLLPPKIVDTNNDGAAELTITIPVRAGATFIPGGSSLTAIVEGITCRVEGSLDSKTFNAPVTEITPHLGTGAAPAGYVFKTFRLNSSLNTNRSGFLRVSATAP